MTLPKRIMDICLSALALLFLWPVIATIALCIFFRDGRPVFYPAERMRSPSHAITLLKFRTMLVATTNAGVTGADKGQRITANGRLLRRTRLDELPQFLNVLKGDISLVGPRPPLREYVDAAPHIYAQVLKSRPGITGLATLVYHQHEEWLLSQCATPEDTHDVYLNKCVPAKARLDLMYQKNRSVCFDIVLLWRTFASVLKRR